MPSVSSEYNPLDYANLTRNCVEELLRRGPFSLPLNQEFTGAGVYALFYRGSEKVYELVRSVDCSWPIYVGKAVPPGGRKGAGAQSGTRPLYGRIMEHCKSIQVVQNLDVNDFVCRYLVVTPLWITMAERFLLEHYKPIWNVCLEGFGNHDPGSGRHQGEITWWDALHPGRAWATKLRQTRTAQDARHRLRTFLDSHKKQNKENILKHRTADEDLITYANTQEEE